MQIRPTEYVSFVGLFNKILVIIKITGQNPPMSKKPCPLLVLRQPSHSGLGADLPEEREGRGPCHVI